MPRGALVNDVKWGTGTISRQKAVTVIVPLNQREKFVSGLA